VLVEQVRTWEQFPRLRRQLLDGVYDFVKSRPEPVSTAAPGPKWQNVMIYKDDAPTVEVGVLVSKSFSPTEVFYLVR
jgi:hypothetical protein